MKEFSKEELDEIKKKLKPYWNDYKKLETDFFHKVNELQKKMNKELKLGIDLEFFYVEGECEGIGAENYGDRDNFPLIQGSDLD